MARLNKCRAPLISPFSLLALLVLSPKVSGWGHEGHCIVANIAYSRLTPDVQDAVDAILSYNVSDAELVYGHDGKYDPLNTSPLAAVANWADKVRFTTEYHWTTPLHFVDVRDDRIDGGCPCTRRNVGESGDMMNDNDDEAQSCTIHSSCRFVYDRDCTKDFCAVGGIANYTSRLVTNFHPSSAADGGFLDFMLRGNQEHSPDRKKWPAKEALMFLTHFVGEYQPFINFASSIPSAFICIGSRYLHHVQPRRPPHLTYTTRRYPPTTSQLSRIGQGRKFHSRSFQQWAKVGQTII